MANVITLVNSGVCHLCGKPLVQVPLGKDFSSSECPSCGIIFNVKHCDYCRGPVDKHRHLFQCRKCGSIGDPFMGLMEPPIDPIMFFSVEPLRRIRWQY